MFCEAKLGISDAIFFIKGLVCGLGYTQPLMLFSCFLALLLHVGPRCLGCRFHHPRNTPPLHFAVLRQILAWQQFPWSASKHTAHSSRSQRIATKLGDRVAG